jgi:hypothetical protein
MLELMICSLVTIVPDYLYRRYVQGKRFGKQITFFSVWYELRWGITGCLTLTISLITMIFYYQQFLVRTGDVVNQLIRPAGVLIPEGAARSVLQAGFGQIEAQVMKPGIVAEATCISKPWVIIPLVVTGVQDYIAAGQFRSGEQLLEAQNLQRPGTILAFLEPLYNGGLEGVAPGSSCIVNAYTSHHDVIADPKTGALKGFALHAVDATGLVHALVLRIQALLPPIKTLVLGGH